MYEIMPDYIKHLEHRNDLLEQELISKDMTIGNKQTMLISMVNRCETLERALLLAGDIISKIEKYEDLSPEEIKRMLVALAIEQNILTDYPVR